MMHGQNHIKENSRFTQNSGRKEGSQEATCETKE